MRRVIIALAAAAFTAIAVPAFAKAPKLQIPPPVAVPLMPADAKVRSFSLDRLVSQLALGDAWGVFEGYMWCGKISDLTWSGREHDLRPEGVAALLRQEARAAGFSFQADSENLFEEQARSDFAIATAIRSLQGRFCDALSSTPDLDIAKGEIIMEMEWQVQDRLERKVVARIVTRGGAEAKSWSEGNFHRVLSEALRQNVRGLLASDQFRKAVTAPVTGTNAAAASVAPAQDLPLLRMTADKSAKPGIAGASASVALVMAKGGNGSAFLVSKEGHLITAEHVVGAERRVKLRWPDGKESVAEVLRTDKVRDAALLKIDPVERQPLPFRQAPVALGEAVIAIGTPLEETYQGTVTRGIVSSQRQLRGVSWIQSDVSVNHGNSGGPLLDESGRVVGITNWGVAPNDVPMDINFFAPIGDVCRRLRIEQ